MPRNAGENSRDALLAVGTDLMRRSGYTATSVEEICTAAGVTKGAFFHHFSSKEALAKECLSKWQEQMAALHRNAPYQAIEDPVAKVLAAIDFMATLFAGADVPKSCLAGTTVQEVSESNPVLREAAEECLATGERYFQSLLDAACQSAACRARGVKLDTASLAELWMGTVQGSLLLAKASQDPTVIGRNLAHFKNYVRTLLEQAGVAEPAAPSIA